MKTSRRPVLRLYRKIGVLLSLQGAAQKQGRHPQEADLGIANRQAMICSEEQILWFGSDQKIPKEMLKGKKVVETVVGPGVCVLPGFVECHTHLVFGGSRAEEFEQRLRGVSYQDIAAAGGGIQSTVRATRELSDRDLLSESQKRADLFSAQGVRTLEVKSGYGLNLEDELRLLRIARKLKGPEIVTTFLGAHSRSPQFATEEEQLAEHLQNLSRIRKLASRVDAFIEKGFFSPEKIQPYLRQFQEQGFQVSIHADQLTLSGGTGVAVQLNASSADHVIQLDDATLNQLAKSPTVAVALPVADLYMRCAYPRVRELIDRGGRVALATDFNPGTAPSMDLALVGMLARLQMRMTLPEVICAYTVNAAQALGLQGDRGVIAAGMRADLAFFEGSWRDLFYSPGMRCLDL